MTGKRGCVVLVLALAPLAGCGPSGAAPPTGPAPSAAGPAALPTVPVTVAPVAVRAVPRTVSAVGTLTGWDEVTLAPKADGRVARIWADVGDPAVPGAVLLDVDPTDHQLKAEAARRELDAELAKLGLLALPEGDLDVSAVPSVRKAEVALANARVRFKRVQELRGRGVSQDEYDVAATEVKLAEATKEDTVTQARATLAAARQRSAALASARQKLDDCRLTVPTPPGWHAWAAAVGPGLTPARYTVARRLITAGDLVREMEVREAFRLVIDSGLKLRAAVPERFAADVRVGQGVAVRVDAYPGKAFAGQVARVSPAVDPQSRTFQVEIAVPNLDGKLKCGGFARAEIAVRTDPAVLTVPPAAVHTFAGVAKVFVAADGKARPVEVAVGARERDWTEVAGDLPPTATVCTSGLSQLVDGSPLRVRE